jgi:hypothetical protein
VSKVLGGGGGGTNLSFRRRFGDRETLEWEELEECLNSVQLSEEVDTICWALTKNRQFSIASLYKHCASSGVIDVRMEEMWNARIPLKVRNFSWLVFQGRIQTTDNLSRKAWRGEVRCKFCIQVENVDHLIFTCPLSAFVWSVIKEGLNWEKTLKSI